MQEEVLVAPSILAADLGHLADELESVSTADLIHFDVMDGHFVPNISFGPDILRAVKSCSELPVDCHLMVDNPESMIGPYLDAGADMVSFHMEATAHANRLAYQIHERGAKAGVVINPATPVSCLEAIVEDVDLVLVMTVNPGFGGQPFIESSLRKLRNLRRLCSEHGVSPLVEVDGGIVSANAGKVVSAGANVLVAGSSVFGKPDRAQAIDAIRKSAATGIARKA